MDVRRFGPDDPDALAAWVAVANASAALDAPWLEPLSLRQADAMFRYGWDGEPAVAYLACEHGEPVAAGAIATSDYDNLDVAWLPIQVRPDLRRRGLGTRLFESLVEQAHARGRTTLGTWGWEGQPAAGFAAARGLEPRSHTTQRRQVVADLDWGLVESLHAEASRAAAGYALERRVGVTPEHDLPSVAALTACINDAPTDDLVVEDEVFPPERIRVYERCRLASGQVLHRVLARHRATGELAGHTVVVVDGERPRLAEQHDTAVAVPHRGHRLGLLLKTAMNLWLREVQPQVERIDTWNAESNRHMVTVNEAIGYRPVGHEVVYQRP